MATTKFNNIILEVAQKLKDVRTTAAASGDTGKVYNSALLTRYVNRAVRDFLTEQFKALGEGFGAAFPEYMKTSGVLALTAGVATKPSEAWYISDLWVSDLSVAFYKLKGDEIGPVKTGQSRMIVPSATKPVFWEEGGNVYTLGVINGNVIARYVKTHQDLSVIVGVASNGKFYTTSANITWTAATKILKFTGAAGVFTPGSDENKPVMFRTAAIVYAGRIVSITVTADTAVVLDGDGLPAGDIGAATILDVMMADVWPDGADLILNDNHSGAIIDRAVRFGLADAENGVV